MAMPVNPGQEKNIACLVEDIQVIPFDAAAGTAYGQIRKAIQVTKNDALDKLIAAHAVANNLTLAINNQKDFVKYPGVVLEN